MIKKTEWFWSYRIGKTEQWLREQASLGRQLVNVNFATRTFTFEEAEPTELHYHIDYKNDKQEARLQQAGWENVVKKGNWTIRATTKPTLYPSRQPLFKRLQTLKNVTTAAFVTVSIYLTITLTFLMLMKNATMMPVFLFVLLIILPGLGGIVISNYFKKRELELLQIEGAVKRGNFKKLRYGLVVSSAGTKEWLEKMEKDGYEVVKVSQFFFHFQEKQTDYVDYEILFGKSSNAHTIQFAKDMGWQQLYWNNTVLFSLSIWSKPRMVGEPKEELVSAEERKRMLIKESLINSLIIAFIGLANGYAAYTGFTMERMYFKTTGIIQYFWLINASASVIIVIILARIWLSYAKQVKKQNSATSS